MQAAYIHTSSCISPQASFGQDALFEEVRSNTDNVLYCLEPEYRNYINPVQIRRMSRALKMGFTAALDCLQRADEPKPGGIIVGTGKGCMSDTEEFLHSIRDLHETALNPTHFIHSTYNQINGLVALNKKINSYNVTYVHRGFSFEHALLDAMLLLSEGEAETVLAGSFEEMTREHFAVKQQWGYWKEEKVGSLDLLRSQTPGTIAGEGSSFFLLGNQPKDESSVVLREVVTLYRPTETELQEAIDALLHRRGLKAAEISHLMLGEDGDIRRAAPYRMVQQQFPNSEALCFKHLCGEYDTATNFGFWLAVQILQGQMLPDYLRHPAYPALEERAVERILLYNNYFEKNQTLMLLERNRIAK